MNTRARPARLAITGQALVAAISVACASPAMAEIRELVVDWSDPEIQSFAGRARTRGAAVTNFDRRLAQLKLPVLGFQRPTASVRRAFGPSQPAAIRSLTMDESNPVWYEISYDYGTDVKITIEADLRVQTKLAPGAKVYSGPRNLSLDNEISVTDDKSEVGMIGAIAEFKVYKFGRIPYSVTIECSEKSKAVCQDVDAIKRDRQFLKLIAAEPPR